jgi:hypothetical protein
MKGFEPFDLTWGGETYSVEAHRQMELIMRVEDGLIQGRPVQAFEVLAMGTVPPIGRLARVYCDALRYASAPVTDAEVYQALVASMRTDGKLIVDVMQQLLGVLGLLGTDEEVDTPKGASTAKKPTAPAE